MPNRLTLVEVGHPHRLGPLVRQNQYKTETPRLARDGEPLQWAPLDWRRFQREPENYQTTYSHANLGRLRAARLADRCATQFAIRSPVAEAFWVCVFERGTGKVALPGSAEPITINTSTGTIRADLPGTWTAAGDDNSRIGIWIPACCLHRKLEVLLDGQNAGSLAFHPAFDLTHGAGATIHRLLGSLFTELEQPESLLGNEIVISSFVEHLMLCLLLGLRHNYSEELHQQRASCAPGNVKRAEDFMRANLDVPLTIDAIADAAACSVRALQFAFRRFRGTTPMAAMQRFRLEAARADILRRTRNQSLTGIAAAYGFTNPGRFAQLFRRTYGAYPSEALQARRAIGDGASHSATFLQRERPGGWQ
jgi:AraC-like DNA-binding protein